MAIPDQKSKEINLIVHIIQAVAGGAGIFPSNEAPAGIWR
jgi:hypothetical protein